MTATIIFADRMGKRREVAAPFGESLMSAALKAGVPGIEGTCGGTMTCLTCLVEVAPEWRETIGPPGLGENQVLGSMGMDGPGMRLACQIVSRAEYDWLSLQVGN